MGSNVIGSAITTRTLKKMEEYKDRPFLTYYDLAATAFEAKNEDDRGVKAREYLERYQTKYGLGDATLCMIYNATGQTMIMDTYCDVEAFIAPSPYPMIIGNGQWGVFLKRGGGAVVYKVRDVDGHEHQVAFMYYSVQPGRCYTEIREANYYKAKDQWTTYQTPLNEHTSYVYQAHEHGISSFASIGGTTRSPVFEGIVTLKDAWSNRYPILAQPLTLVPVTTTTAYDHPNNSDGNNIDIDGHDKQRLTTTTRSFSFGDLKNVVQITGNVVGEGYCYAIDMLNRNDPNRNMSRYQTYREMTPEDAKAIYNLYNPHH